MTTRLVRKPIGSASPPSSHLCLARPVGVTSFVLNRSGNGQKDPTAIAYEDYEEDEDLKPGGRSPPHGHGQVFCTAMIDTITYEQSYEGTTCHLLQAYVYVPASHASDTPANVSI